MKFLNSGLYVDIIAVSGLYVDIIAVKYEIFSASRNCLKSFNAFKQVLNVLQSYAHDMSLLL